MNPIGDPTGWLEDVDSDFDAAPPVRNRPARADRSRTLHGLLALATAFLYWLALSAGVSALLLS